MLIVGSAQASELSLDALAFKADAGRVYLELHLDLPRAAAAHRQEADGWYGSLLFTVAVQHDGITLARDEWRVEDLAAEPSALASGQRIVDARIYEMPPGNYDINATATDSISGRRFTAHKAVALEWFPDSLLTVSDIQLSPYLVEGGIHPRFDRGGYSLIPNPRRLFAPPGTLFYYFEIYPPASVFSPPSSVLSPPSIEGGGRGGLSAEASTEYTIERAILGGAGDTLRALPTVSRFSGEPFAVVDSLSVAGLSGGTYQFALSIRCGALMASRRAKFFLYRPDSLHQPQPEIDSAAVARELAEVEFLLTRDQIEVAGRMSPAEKSRFLTNFWRRYDDQPTTPDVPLRHRFRARVEEADERWTNSRSAGHQTDRGRVYVLHGEPDEREIHTLDLHAKPYEIWNYNNVEGGVIFVFVDRSGLGEFSLVHSTLRGEVSNSQWYESYVIRSGPETRK